ncbi:MAG: hypothetical protein H6645_00325 [Caldilineaceae bacterium]|nr:hypothetical protein [Caldilineaceae bacterium]MCB9155545.1 hypothetical protein [Caldilineaceae bacterium]
MGVELLENTAITDYAAMNSPAITNEQAVYVANGYLAEHVSTCFGAAEPVLLFLERLTWQVLVYFKQPFMKPFNLAFLDVDAETGKVYPFTEYQIETLLTRADAFAKLNPPSATPGG